MNGDRRVRILVLLEIEHDLEAVLFDRRYGVQRRTVRRLRGGLIEISDVREQIVTQNALTACRWFGGRLHVRTTEQIVQLVVGLVVRGRTRTVRRTGAQVQITEQVQNVIARTSAAVHGGLNAQIVRRLCTGVQVAYGIA